ncbi:uncharacterized protein EV420DRAFT_1750576 [Desarmillaria tabescens]|uniref:Uncharacterized protein n=1 Tax=Armillaria tabescens TaxID=1929756 RepID=A0AA39JVX7_ARMTA|nr:uncharacterized protein EV420DRAFT_1750576 [Desarmillaria tabescens]KAK0449804.1 hypothetical protein EV420DRAFT_1750576 [Desarmillaria tabescens]
MALLSVVCLQEAVTQTEQTQVRLYQTSECRYGKKSALSTDGRNTVRRQKSVAGPKVSDDLAVVDWETRLESGEGWEIVVRSLSPQPAAPFLQIWKLRVDSTLWRHPPSQKTHIPPSQVPPQNARIPSATMPGPADDDFPALTPILKDSTGTNQMEMLTLHHRKPVVGSNLDGLGTCLDEKLGIYRFAGLSVRLEKRTELGVARACGGKFVYFLGESGCYGVDSGGQSKTQAKHGIPVQCCSSRRWLHNGKVVLNEAVLRSLPKYDVHLATKVAAALAQLRSSSGDSNS